MRTKIIKGKTIQQYTNKFKQPGLRKILKKDVEKNESLLEGSSWWLIEDVYYEAPVNKKKLGIIIGSSLLAAGLIATSITLPIVLNQKGGDTPVQPEPTVEHEAVIDASVKDVTLSQKKLASGDLEVTLQFASTKELASVDVKIGNQVLVKDTDYTLANDKVVIKKVVLENNKTKEIVIKPVLKDKVQIITKAQWFEQNKILVNGFLKSSLVYTTEQFTAKMNDEEQTIATVGYDTDDKGYREFYYRVEGESGHSVVAEKDIIDEKMMSFISDENSGGHFKINEDGSTEYYCDSIPAGKYMWIKTLNLNKFGYPTKQIVAMPDEKTGEIITNSFEYTYDGDPQEELQEIDFKDFMNYYATYYASFQNSNTKYTKNQLSNWVYYDNGTETELDINTLIYGYESSIRYCELTDGNKNNFIVAGQDSPTNLNIDKNGSFYYNVLTGSISYKSSSETYNGLVKLTMNKFGYLENRLEHSTKDEFTSGQSIIYTDEPQDVTVSFELIYSSDKGSYGYLSESAEEIISNGKELQLIINKDENDQNGVSGWLFFDFAGDAIRLHFKDSKATEGINITSISVMNSSGSVSKLSLGTDFIIQSDDEDVILFTDTQLNSDDSVKLILEAQVLTDIYGLNTTAIFAGK